MSIDKDRAIRLERYTPRHSEVWDQFVDECRNGTFLHKRGYMDYHSDRFSDHSLIFLEGDDIVALLPANITEDTLYSHRGLTYGGLLIGNNTTAQKVLTIFTLLIEYLKRETTVKRLVYRTIPHIYHRYPCEEELYALFRNNATLTERKISSAVKLDKPLPFHGRRKLTNAVKSRLHIVEDDNFQSFWEILTDRLQQKYEVCPVHSCEEIKLLHNRFPENIKLFRVTDADGNTLGGTIIYITESVAHSQYIATTAEGRRIGALDYLHSYLIQERFTGCGYFDFGISTEGGGRLLNSGLIAQKEGFGGRAVMYDTYTIEILQEPR